MEQKIIWTHFLIIGISAVTFFSIIGCDHGETDYIQRAEYVYMNKLNQQLRFEIYDTYTKASYEFVLHSQDSVSFFNNDVPVAFPFSGNEVANRIGDSIVFRFNNNKCVHYLRNNYTLPFGGDGVFNLTEYENYSQTLVNQQDYRLVYHIDQKDIERAVDCL
ncbi:MAG: hypothetical protein O9340_13160 [Cyclobacteriaceae bacterium]|nr:hypothetical protein [Cyclobacteriaceae bacterium]